MLDLNSFVLKFLGYYPFAESLKIIRISCGGGFSKFTTKMSNFSAKFATMFLVSESILSLIVYDWRAGYNPFAEFLKLIRISSGDGFSKFATRCQTFPSLSPLSSPLHLPNPQFNFILHLLYIARFRPKLDEISKVSKLRIFRSLTLVQQKGLLCFNSVYLKCVSHLLILFGFVLMIHREQYISTKMASGFASKWSKVHMVFIDMIYVVQLIQMLLHRYTGFISSRFCLSLFFAILQQQRSFIQMRTILKVVDNLWATKVMCIQALKGKKGARLGDTIVASVEEAHPN
ncbi:50s ribosomal protein hlp [Quercus suber]|uniref:50s ribosomal protein hlp n=1 Tax=Quercus suber TaxID=58331 RepID=A0AAW0MAX9_QUESU